MKLRFKSLSETFKASNSLLALIRLLQYKLDVLVQQWLNVFANKLHLDALIRTYTIKNNEIAKVDQF